MTLIMYILRLISGADPGFQVRGADLKKLRRAEGGGGGGGGGVPGAGWDPLDPSLGHLFRNFGINLNEVIDRFIWTIELCNI